MKNQDLKAKLKKYGTSQLEKRKPKSDEEAAIVAEILAERKSKASKKDVAEIKKETKVYKENQEGKLEELTKPKKQKPPHWEKGFLKPGTEVEFEAARNSIYHGQALRGTIVCLLKAYRDKNENPLKGRYYLIQLPDGTKLRKQTRSVDKV